MAIGEESGEFSYSITSSSFKRDSGGGTQVVINVEGNASGFGQINGTLTLLAPAPGANAGSGTFTGAVFAESGEVLGTTGEGYWQQLDGEQKWRVRGINANTNGDILVSDGTLDLATRSFNGTFAEWT